ncbi:MAG: PIN domain-containing protein [Acidobacteria bacterium]|nr:PIN domain-containing protein [Acidobacteriota bacterium]NIM60952.1 PIN domain-containing protein [Acidobacteriota bacterium]NIO60442.1 PIN domain-containing protein [Acidobacteriota bacterium]NIQ31540.1 PIN domain-containing protein [Acidobacteriota bacterium]NIQ86792.1 PIN domain-containing protein [Acidobacteriota bacterium]
MQARGLIDTGAILALLDADDRWHERCREAFESLRLPLATTPAILAEVFHLLGDHPRDVAATWRFLRSGAVTLLPVTDADSGAMEALMKRYRDRPMDFADATLVHLAEREKLTTILTVDHADFETYRIGKRKRFRVVPTR